MGRKLAGIIGIAAAVLTFSVGTAAAAGQLHQASGSHTMVAALSATGATCPNDVQNPTCSS